MQQYKKNGAYTKTFIDFMHKMYLRYLSAHHTDLQDVYVKPSQRKLDAMERIKIYKAGYTPYIISHNAHHFTVAYFCYEEELEYFCVDTGRNTYIILAMFV